MQLSQHKQPIGQIHRGVLDANFKDPVKLAENRPFKGDKPTLIGPNAFGFTPNV